MDKIKKMLKDLKSYNAVGSALINRDGTLISADFPQGTNVETFTIMMATMLGAASTAAKELNKAQPNTVVIHSADSKMVLSSTGNKAFLVVILPSNEDITEILRESEKIIKYADKNI